MTSLSRPAQLKNATKAFRMPLAFLFSRLTRESYVKIILVLLGIMILLQLSVSPLMRLSNGLHLRQSLLRMRRQENDSDSNELNRKNTVTASKADVFSAFQDDDDSKVSVIKSSSLSLPPAKGSAANKTEKDYSKELMADHKLPESQLSLQNTHKAIAAPSVIENIYPRPRKHRLHKNKGRNILDLSAKSKPKFAESNEVLLNEKLKTYKKNLTALLSEIPLPATTPAFDIVNPGASAEEHSKEQQLQGKPLCPAVPPNLEGPLQVAFSMPPMARIESKFPDVINGRWSPKNCTARHRVAIVIPFRDREEHLRIFLNHIHAFLQKQLLDYGIYIVEQAGTSRFNRAMLMNIGFMQAGRLYDNQCYIFHDVDLLPEDDRNLYSCPSQPRHMSAGVDTMSYKLPYQTIFGGVVAFKKEHFQKVNGFSNCFFGWGGEDDDLYNRMKHKGYRLKRYPLRIARYRMINHMKAYPSPGRFKYLHSGSDRYDIDGLNSLKYKLFNITRHKLFTTITVDIDEDQVMKDFLITEMPPNLNLIDVNQLPNEAAGEGDQKIKTQNHYTIIKQSDIELILEDLREKAQKKKKQGIIALPFPKTKDNSIG